MAGLKATRPAAGLSRPVMALSLIVILAGAAAAYYALSSGPWSRSTLATQSTATDLRSLNQTFASLAYAHWESIAQKNLTAVMSQYSTEYEALWWYVNSSAPLGPYDGKHDCNVPTGPGTCSGVLSSAWQQFFDNVSSPSMKLGVCGFTTAVGEPGNAFSRANVTYFLSRSNETIVVPYQIDFRVIGGQWQLQRDWFGLPGDFATVHPGDVLPRCR